MKSTFLLLCLFTFFTVNSVAQYTITTISGNGIAGYNGDNIRADSAELNMPSSVYFSYWSTLYIADTKNNRIRKVDIHTNKITTYAGTGGTITTSAYMYHNVPDSVAINEPLCAAANDSNELYISETPHSTIWKLDPGRFPYPTFGRYVGDDTAGYMGDGGYCPGGRVDHPAGICFNNSSFTRKFKGTFTYIADKNNHVIRCTDRFTYKINTFAGNGTAGYSGDGGIAIHASFSAPFALATDRFGNLYIADSGNHTVRKIDSLGIVTTVAGTGVAGYSGDGGLADTAMLNSPQGVGVDDTGNVYISDAANNRIRKISIATGIITTIAGTGVAGFSGDGGKPDSAEINYPRGLFVDVRTATIYFADSKNNRVRKLALPPTSSTVNHTSVQPAKIYPNPSTGIVNIENSNTADHSSVSVYNILGKQVYQTNFSTHCTIDLSGQPNGIYLLQLNSGQQVVNKKIIIAH